MCLVGNVSAVVATDNCAGALTVTFADVMTPGSCPNRFTIARTYTVTDVCGNASAQTQTITVDDQTAPVITSIPANVTVSCASDVPTANTVAVVATDNCAGTLTVTFADVTTPGSCANRYSIARTYTVTDVCGNASAQTQTITVDDQIAPVITSIPANVTVSCASDVPVGNTSAVVATDNCAGTLTITFADVTTPGSCPNRYTIARTYTVTDVCGNASAQIQTITVDDQIAPVITSIPANVTVSCAADVPVADITAVVATDNCAGTLTVTFADVTTPGSCANRYSIARTYTVTDVCGNASTQTQTITVDDQIAPVITSIPANVTVSCAANVPVGNTSAVVATDNCAGILTITFADVTTPGSCPNRYTIARTYTVTDVCGNASTQTQTITVDDQIAPVITSIPANVTVSCASDVPVGNTSAVVATDNCAGALTVTYIDVTTPGSCPNMFTIARTYTVTDVCGNASTQTQTITVDDQIAPVITSIPANVTVSCAANVPVGNTSAVVATDNCAGTLTVTFADVTTPGSCANRYSIARTYTVTDVCGNASTQTQTITVDDKIAPVITSIPANVTVSCASDVPVGNTSAVVATDNCAGTLTVTFIDITTPGSCPNRFTIARTYTVTDACGNASTQTQTITVDDQTAPVITSIPANVTVSCAADVPAGNVSSVVATDNCAGALTITFADVTTPGSCPNRFTIARTYTVTDVCGNASAQIQTITVDDQIAPVITSIPANVTVSCASDVPVGNVSAVVATDNCAGTLTVTFADVTTPGSCPNRYTIARTYTVTDVCGNASSQTQTITVDDQIAPVITSIPANVTVSCAADVPVADITAVVATDNCAGTLTVTFADVTTPGSCPNRFTIARTYTVTDVCGNASTQTQTITVDDQTAPVITSIPANVTVSCASDVPVGNVSAVVATDNCAGTLTVSFSDVMTPGSCPNRFTIARTYTVTDVCGNASALTQTITVDDQTAPVITSIPANVTVSCASDVPTANTVAVVATDNCAGTLTVTFADVTTPGSCANRYSIARTYTVTDVCGNASAQTQTITVDDQIAPVITSIPANVTVSCASDVPAGNVTAVVATDNCAGTLTVTFADVTTPGSCPNRFTIARTYTVTDVCGNASTQTQTITVDDQIAPVITTASGSLDVNLQCSDAAGIAAALAMLPTATDNCTANPVINLVSDVTTPDASCANAYVRVRTWNFTDGCGNTSANFVQTITVIDNTAPVITTAAGSLDVNLQCSDAAGIAAALAVLPTATDNCTANPVINLVSDVTTPDGSCANAYVRVRTWNFTDGCGNTSANFVQTITVIDNTAPVITTAAGSLDVNLQCSDAAGIAAALAMLPTATDNCTSNPVINLVSDVTTPDASCANAYVRVRTWNFTDGCGNTSANFVQTITVIDNTAPVITTAAGSLDVNLQCSDAAGIAAALAMLPTATDNCTSNPVINLVSDVTTPDGSCANAYVRVRTWNFTDGCGNTSANFVQTITVIDNTAPVITTAAGSLDVNLQCSDAAGIAAALAVLPTATDNCTANPVINLVSDVTTPDGSCANAYVRVRTWNFTDGCGNTSANFVQTITVIDNTAPVITTAAGSLDVNLQCSDAAGIAAALAMLPTATDNCTSNPVINLVSDVTTPDGSCANAYVRVRTWNFTDGCGNTSANFVQTITVIDNTAPVITTAAGSLDVNLQCSDAAGIAAALAMLPTATDNCTANPVINLVSDVTTPDASCANAYVRVRTWNFTDGCGNTSANFVQTITVIDNTAPVITTAAGSLDVNLQCSDAAGIAAALAMLPTATDNCTANPVINLVSDVTTPDASCANAYVRVRTWNFTDGCGNTSANFVQTITVIDNTAPVITTAAGSLDVNLQCSDAAGIAAALAMLPTATDNCTANPVINLVSDVTTPDASCANAYVRVRTWNFTDGCGNTSANFVQTITVIDNTAPVITTAAGSLDVNLQCSDAAGIAAALAVLPTATDNCTANPVINLVSDVTTPDGSCANAYVRVRTWNFTDGCGNTSANFVQTITVIDNTAPVITTAAGSLDVNLQCSDAAGIAAALAMLPTATDNCTSNPVINLVSDVTTPDASCANAYVRVRTWNFTDGCGNTSANFVQTITVIDNTAPVITTAAGSLDVNLQCSDAAGIAAALAMLPTATDNCTANPVINLVSDVTTPDASCANAYVRVRTWNFTDGCGNTSANFVQTITVIDNTAPVITTAAGSLDVNLQCSDPSGLSAALALFPSATDNCSQTTNIHLVSDITTPDPNCLHGYIRERVWNFSDGCGNVSPNFVQTIVVKDTIAPIILTSSGSLNSTLQCSNIPGIALALSKFPTASDNCTSAPNMNLISDIITPHPTCPSAYTRVRIWNFDDGCGNISQNFTQTIQVIDNTPPVGTPPIGTTMNNSCISAATTLQPFNPIAAAAGYTDNCGGPVTAILTNTSITGNNCSWMVNYTFRVEDNCGNALYSQNIIHTGGDKTAPVFTNCPTNISVQTPSLIPVPAAVTAIDCDNTIISIDLNTVNGFFKEIEFDVLSKPGYCPDSIYRYYIAQDACFNRDTCLQVIKVLDTISCQLCQDKVNYWPVNLYSSPSTADTLLQLERNGLCCSEVNPSKCVAFNMHLHPNAIGLQIITGLGGINNPNWNQGQQSAGEWQIECGPSIWDGNTMCLTGKTFFTLTHCKPGANSNHYAFVTIGGMTVSPGWTVRRGCGTGQQTTITGVDSSTVVFTDLTGNGQYLSYLTHPSGSLTTQFLPDSNAPQMIQYAVCGSLLNNVCNTTGVVCDTITFYTVDPLTISLFEPPLICPGDPQPFTAVAAPYTLLYNYQWYQGYDSSGAQLQNGGGTFTPTQPGQYSVVAIDISSGYGCNRVHKNFDVIFDEIGPIVIAPDTLILDCIDPNIPQKINAWLNSAIAYDTTNTTYSLTIVNDYTPFAIFCGSLHPAAGYHRPDLRLRRPNGTGTPPSQTGSPTRRRWWHLPMDVLRWSPTTSPLRVSHCVLVEASPSNGRSLIFVIPLQMLLHLP
jgi:hypothetical protein